MRLKLDLTSLMSLGVVLTVLSFCSSQTIASFCTMAMYVVWAIFAVILLKRGIQIDKRAFYMLFVFAVMTVAGRVFYSLGLYRSGGAGPAGFLIYCAIFYAVGFNFLPKDHRDLRRVVIAYVAAQIIFVLLGRSFGIEAKNQAGQVIGVGIIIELFYLPVLLDTKKKRYVSILLGIVAIVFLFLIHSRAPFFAIILLGMFLLIRKQNKPFYYVLLIVAIVAFSMFSRTDVGNSLVYDFMQGDNRYSALTLDSIVSGRLGTYVSALKAFIRSPIIGVGGWYYVDSFSIHVLATGGLLGGILLFPIAYGYLGHSILSAGERIKRIDPDVAENDSDYQIGYLCLLLSFYYLMISFFEGYPPVGPRTSVFFLWIVTGMYSRSLAENEIIGVKK